MKSGKIKNKNRVDERNKAKFLRKQETVSTGKNKNEVLVKSNTIKPALQKSYKGDKNKEEINQPILKQKEQKNVSTARLISYRKKDLSDINYFVPKKNSENCYKKTNEASLNNPSIKETSQNLEPSITFWNQSIENLENDLKQIMIQEKKQRIREMCQKKNSDVRVPTSTKSVPEGTSGRNLLYRNNSHQDYKFPIATYQPLSQNINHKYLLDENEDNFSISTNNSTCLSEETPYRKFSLDEFIVKKKESPKTKECTKRENENPLALFKSTNEQLHPPAAVAAWLKNNEICLDQIIIEEKIKRQQLKEKHNLNSCDIKDCSVRKNPYVNPNIAYTQSCLGNSSQNGEVSLGDITTDEQVKILYREQRQRLESNQEGIYNQPEDLHMSSRRHSLDYYGYEYAKEKLNLNICDKKLYSQRKDSHVNRDTTWAPLFLDDSSQKSAISLGEITTDKQVQKPYREQRQRLESYQDTIYNRPEELHRSSRKYSLDYYGYEYAKEILNLNTCDEKSYSQSYLDDSSQESEISLGEITLDDQIQRLHQRQRLKSDQDKVYYEPEGLHMPSRKYSLDYYDNGSKMFANQLNFNKVKIDKQIPQKNDNKLYLDKVKIKKYHKHMTNINCILME